MQNLVCTKNTFGFKTFSNCLSALLFLMYHIFFLKSRRKEPSTFRLVLGVLKGGVRTPQVFLNLIRLVHCVSPPSLLCLHLSLHLVSVHNFYAIGGAGNVRKFACRMRNHCGSNEYCEKAMNGAKKR